jgi:hypothetical protein
LYQPNPIYEKSPKRRKGSAIELPIGIYIFGGAILVVVVVLVALFLLGRRNRGRLIKCPKCGTQFKRPAYAEKTVGMGPVPALPGVGDFTCPKCKYRANTSNFRYVTEKESSNPIEK